MPTLRKKSLDPKWVIGQIVKYLLLIGVGVLAFAPLLWVVSTSFKTTEDIFSGTVTWIPPNPTLNNYLRAFTEYDLVQWLINSLSIAFFTIALSCFFYIMPAYALAKLDFKLKPILMVLMMATIMIPKELSAIPLYKVVRQLGLLDTHVAVIVPQICEAIGVFLLVQFFTTIPDAYIEVAKLEGCRHWTILWRIFVPLAGPAVAVMVILTFVNSWNNFFWPLLVTFSNKSFTLPVGLSQVMVSYSEASAARQYGLLMAISIIASLPTIVVFLLLQNRFVEGITATGIKG